jgi:hypothetical protein
MEVLPRNAQGSKMMSEMGVTSTWAQKREAFALCFGLRMTGSYQKNQRDHPLYYL